MLKTAAELIKAAQAQVPHVSAQEAATEAASGAAVYVVGLAHVLAGHGLIVPADVAVLVAPCWSRTV